MGFDVKYLNSDNLKILANYLNDNVIDDQFDMACYRKNEKGVSVAFCSLENCGTVGCAMGWAPYALNLSKDDIAHIRKRAISEFNFWIILANTYFSHGHPDFDESGIWNFLFCTDWEFYDNSRHGAVERLNFIADLVEKEKWEGLRKIDQDMFVDDHFSQEGYMKEVLVFNALSNHGG